MILLVPLNAIGNIGLLLLNIDINPTPLCPSLITPSVERVPSGNMHRTSSEFKISIEFLIAFLSKEFLLIGKAFKNDTISPNTLLLNTFPVNRNTLDRKAIKNSCEILNSDEVLCMFPEGTRSTEGVIRDGHKGVGLISILSSSSPILPMALSGTNKIIQKPRKRIFFPKVKIIYGNLIDTSSIIKENDNKTASNIILNKTMGSIKELYERIK
ncbi:MAG TPA: 1-acyl-sn-glycerol-3-phosphate acyltransferase [Candidatus Lokiarchaeia archaeon]